MQRSPSLVNCSGMFLADFIQLEKTGFGPAEYNLYRPSAAFRCPCLSLPPDGIACNPTDIALTSPYDPPCTCGQPTTGQPLTCVEPWSHSGVVRYGYPGPWASCHHVGALDNLRPKWKLTQLYSSRARHSNQNIWRQSKMVSDQGQFLLRIDDSTYGHITT